jgi:hypothetical protein
MTLVQYPAPWSGSLKVLTVVACLALALGLVIGGLVTRAVVAGAFVMCALLAVRGYSIRDGRLLIHRLGWNKAVDLHKVLRAEADPSAMAGSLRLLGVGGLFAYVGRFRSPKLGQYWSYATCPERAVVIELPGSKVVVTPADPQRFVRDLEAARGGSQVPSK